ncbi:hypothetical protein NEOC95_001053 [Neochlamydia sp. AcF95]|nr:hypothetical protein [Neochlamydia sp. AcF95]
MTANRVMNLTACAKEILKSAEVNEKGQRLDFVFQNVKLDRKTCL